MNFENLIDAKIAGLYCSNIGSTEFLTTSEAAYATIQRKCFYINTNTHNVNHKFSIRKTITSSTYGQSLLRWWFNQVNWKNIILYIYIKDYTVCEHRKQIRVGGNFNHLLSVCKNNPWRISLAGKKFSRILNCHPRKSCNYWCLKRSTWNQILHYTETKLRPQ